MKTISWLTLLAALSYLGSEGAGFAAGEEEGLALAVIYDTSGSMKDVVADKSGGRSPKYAIANRALAAVAHQLEAFATNRGGMPPRRIDVALFTFRNDTAYQSMPLAPLDAAALEAWAKGFSSPNGNTPLGNSLAVAARAVLNSPLPRKHVLLITDGMNTAGPTPESVLPGLKKQAEQKQTTLGVHFVAFDVAAKVFNPVKKLGATVVAAADEKQLDSQLQFILQRKILLEDEEPAKTK